MHKKKQQPISAVWKHPDGYKFNTVYRTRGGFLRAVARSKYCTLDNAVDLNIPFIVRMNNLKQYRELKTNRAV